MARQLYCRMRVRLQVSSSSSFTICLTHPDSTMIELTSRLRNWQNSKLSTISLQHQPRHLLHLLYSSSLVQHTLLLSSRLFSSQFCRLSRFLRLSPSQFSFLQSNRTYHHDKRSTSISFRLVSSCIIENHITNLESLLSSIGSLSKLKQVASHAKVLVASENSSASGKKGEVKERDNRERERERERRRRWIKIRRSSTKLTR